MVSFSFGHEGLEETRAGLLGSDTDWTYANKRDAQLIVAGIWLGPYGCAKDETFLREAHITNILCVRSPEEAVFIRPKYPKRFAYEICEMRDYQFQSIIPHCLKMRHYVDSILASNGVLLIHGNAGMSRSAVLVVGYIMDKFSLDADKAYSYVLSRRHCVSVNEGFKHQLMDLEKLLKARSSNSPYTTFPPTKRLINEISQNEDEMADSHIVAEVCKKRISNYLEP
eukprot:Platyproteum_vivax@DN1008_c0_g1_i1.p1